MKNLILFLGILVSVSTGFAKKGGTEPSGGGTTVPLSPLKVFRFEGVIPPCENNVFNICDTLVPGMRFNLTYSVNPNAAFDRKFTENYPGAASNLTLEIIGFATYTGRRGDVLLHSNGVGGAVYYQVSMLDLEGGLPIPRFSRPGAQNGVSIYILFADNSASMSSLLGKTLRTAAPDLDFQKFTETTLNFVIKGAFEGSGKAGNCTQCFATEFLLTNAK
ncbi:hypothetical protein [Bdellovibrio sp. HCB2-146]|uniref:hypothetical protein n=1 Tax=Bdellovibrio sp. HCB2-146 TaxID=3394362 RepID=UPI0039BD1B18